MAPAPVDPSSSDIDPARVRAELQDALTKARQAIGPWETLVLAIALANPKQSTDGSDEKPSATIPA